VIRCLGGYIPNNTLFLRTIDIEEEAGASMYRRTFIYADVVP